MGNKVNDIVGQRFGNLTVLYREEDYILPKSKKVRARWFCICDCGNYRISQTPDLNKGYHVNCGHCYKKPERIFGNYRKKLYNQYILTGSYGICYISTDLEFTFSLESYEKIKKYIWRRSLNTSYISSNEMINGTHKIHQLHRVLMNISDKNIYVDHIDHNPLNNQLENLRLCTPLQNIHNTKIRKNNTSGVAGVNFSKVMNKWDVRIYINKKRTRLGYFDSFDEAVKIRKQAEIDYYGDFRYKPEMDYRNKKVEVI